VGLVRGFGLKRGAIASTVAHDSHNLLVAGVSDDDMLAAARLLAEVGGGFCAVADGVAVGCLPLPVAGLMSDRPLADVGAGMERLEAAVRALGVQVPSPFMALSFLALPVIPELRLTDMGLVAVDADGVRLVPLNATD
jgi:adenine deaminase